jgi:hypothetical protein
VSRAEWAGGKHMHDQNAIYDPGTSTNGVERSNIYVRLQAQQGSHLYGHRHCKQPIFGFVCRLKGVGCYQI